MLTSISLSPSSARVPVGQTLSMTATGHNSDGSTTDLTATATWSSSNTNVSVVHAGVVAAVSVGPAIVTATSGGLSGTAAVAAGTVFATPSNNVRTRLAADYVTGSRSITVTQGDGPLFGNPTPAAPVRVTVVKAGVANTPLQSPSNLTIFLCTGRSGDTLTVAATEGTTDRDYAVNDVVEERATAGTVSDLHAAVAALELQAAVAAGAGGVSSVAGKTGVVTLSESDVSGLVADLNAKASDASVLHTSGNEVASGTKTFSGVTLLGGGGTQFDTSGFGLVYPVTFLLAQGSLLATGTGLASPGVPLGFAGKVVKWKALAATNPSGGGFTFDVTKNGTSVFATPPSVPANTTAVQSGNSFSSTSAAEGDLFNVNVTAAGTGVQGVRIVLYLLVRNT